MRLSALAWLLLLVGPTPFARSDETELARFNREFPQAVRRLEERFAHVQGSCILQRTSHDQRPVEGRLRPIDDATFNIDHDFEKVTIRRMAPGDRSRPPLIELVYCVGGREGFQIVRPPGATGYTVEGSGTSRNHRDAYLKLFGRQARAHQGVLAQTWTQILASPGFRVNSAERIAAKDGRSLVKVEYEVGGQSPKSRAEVVLDPDAGWVVRSSEFHPGGAPEATFRAEITYKPARDGTLLPKLVTLRDQSGESTCEYTDWSFEPTPEAEFKLPFYGLPDLSVESGGKSSHLPYIYAGISLAGAGVAFFLKRLGR